jgi:hypothetical protein
MAIKNKDLQVTNFYTKISSSTYAGIANDDGLVVLGWWDSALSGDPSSVQSTFAPGCIMLNKSGSSTATVIKANSGTTASVTWTVLNIN